MIPAIKRLYDYFENIKGKKLYFIAIGLTLLCLAIGLAVGQLLPLLTPSNPKEPEIKQNQQPQTTEIERTGKIVFTNPENYPGENISYKLIDEKAKKELILLKAADEKLKFVEGTTAKLIGRLEKTTRGEDVLFVEKIVFNQ